MQKKKLSKQAKPSARQPKKTRLTAATADRYALYELSVQDPKEEVKTIKRIYKKLRGRLPVSLREDFCGTALLCSEWVKDNRQNTATGIDIDRKVLDWGLKHNVEPLGDAASRLELLNQDVLLPIKKKHDLLCAFNFSYWLFQDRSTLLQYFKTARKGLAKEGLFLADAFGGWEANEPMEEVSRVQGFRYVWDQDSYDPINGIAVNHIHFEFPDGSKMREAFTYVWRHWTLPEITELMKEAGFSNVTVYWDVSETDRVADYRPRLVAENQPGWIAYIAGEG